MTDRLTNLKLQINKNIIDKVKSEYNIEVDYLGSVLFILFALNEKRYDLLDQFDDSNKARRAIILYRMMERKELLRKTDQSSNLHYVLTKTALALLEFIKSEFEFENIDIHADSFEPVLKSEFERRMEINRIKKEIINPTAETLEWITEYINIFPEDFQDDKKTVAVRMEDFMKNYPNFNKEIILAATRMYIKFQANSNSGHNFTMRSQYFIWKGAYREKTWTLATWCKRYLDSDKKTDIDTSLMDIA